MGTKGADFEQKACAFLGAIFREIGYVVTEARKQDAGTQNGFDIRIRFIDDGGKERGLYFECKDYTTAISWDAIIAKVAQLDASGHKPDGAIAISPKIDFSNIHISTLDKQEQHVGFPVAYWSPSANAREYFALDTTFYQWLYNEAPPAFDRNERLYELKAAVNAMLRKKDDMQHHEVRLSARLPSIDPDEIIGRGTDLDKLRHTLLEHKSVAVVTGIGGIGKTTLAQAYLGKYHDEYRHVLWISQVSDDIRNDIVATEGLMASLHISTEGKKPDELFAEIMHKLSNLHGQPNLLVFDNAGVQLAGIKDRLPLPPAWHVLATSRGEIERFTTIELGFLSPEDAASLFSKHCSRIADAVAIAELVRQVDYHTLTIEILARVAQERRLNITTLQTAIKDDLKAAGITTAHSGPDGKIERVRSYLSTVFNLSSLTDDQMWLMKQFVCLPPEPHTYKLLHELIAPDEVQDEIFAETLEQLVQQGWLIYNADADTYKMHVVVQEVGRVQMKVAKKDVGGLIYYVSSQLSLEEIEGNLVDRFKWISFGKVLCRVFVDDISSAITKLQNNLALRIHEFGQYSEARALLEKVVQTDEENFGKDHPTTAIGYCNLATVLLSCGEYNDAKIFSEKAVQSDITNFGENHPTVTVSYSNLALVLHSLGEYESAKIILEKVAVIVEENFGEDHHTTIVAYSNLAGVLQDIGEYNRAKYLLEKAMLLSEMKFGKHHPIMAKRYSNLALVLLDIGEYDRARELMEMALKLDELFFGSNHPTTAICYSNLALALKGLGLFEEARSFLEKAILSAEKNFGIDHPNTAISYSNLAVVLKSLGENGKSKVFAQKAHEIFRNKLSGWHPHIQIVQDILDSFDDE